MSETHAVTMGSDGTKPTKDIYALMPLFIRDVGAIPKGKKNPALGYKFRSIDDVLNAVHPVVVKHGISLSFECHDYHTEVIIRTVMKSGKPTDNQVYRATLLLSLTFWAPDGSSVTSTAAGEGLDFGGDKATNKAMSAAFKYACFFGLAIPFVEAEDSDAGGPAAVTPTEKNIKEEGTKPAPPPALVTPPAPKVGHDPSDYSDKVHGPCDEIQQDKIKAFIETPTHEGIVTLHQIKQAFAERGVKKMAELTRHQADDIIDKLERKKLKIEAAETFSPS